MLIVAITGMPGAGKSTAAEALEAKGFKRVVMGDVVRQETKRRGFPPDAESTGKVMLELREQYGAGAVAEVCMQVIRSMNEKVVVVDGIRSVAEVEVFRKAGKVLLIGVHASRERRYSLLKERHRGDAPATMSEFDQRDARELSIGVGNALALADEILPNEHITTDVLGRNVVELVSSWVAKFGD